MESLTLIVPLYLAYPDSNKSGNMITLSLIVGTAALFGVLFFAHSIESGILRYLEYVFIGMGLFFVSIFVCEKGIVKKMAFSAILTIADMLADLIVVSIFIKDDPALPTVLKLFFSKNYLGEIVLERTLHLAFAVGICLLIRKLQKKEK
jgi:hypothetical protein